MGLARALVARGRTAEAVRLFAAAEAHRPDVEQPVGEVTYAAMIAAIGRTCGATRDIAAAWAEGAALDLAQAVAAALAITCPRTVATGGCAIAPARHREPLTRREREIARLLARGESDRQIAEALSISVGTVGVHVHHILQKLELYSRLQVADWLHAQHPD